MCKQGKQCRCPRRTPQNHPRPDRLASRDAPRQGLRRRARCYPTSSRGTRRTDVEYSWGRLYVQAWQACRPGRQMFGLLFPPGQGVHQEGSLLQGHPPVRPSRRLPSPQHRRAVLGRLKKSVVVEYHASVEGLRLAASEFMRTTKLNLPLDCICVDPRRTGPRHRKKCMGLPRAPVAQDRHCRLEQPAAPELAAAWKIWYATLADAPAYRSAEHTSAPARATALEYPRLEAKRTSHPDRRRRFMCL